MKYFLISDNLDTLAGMRLVGVDGVVVHESDEVTAALKKACQDKDIGLVLVAERLCRKHNDIILDYKMNCTTPLFVEMPDRHTTDDIAKGIRQEIASAVGIKI